MASRTGTEQVVKHLGPSLSSQDAAARLSGCAQVWVWVVHQARQDPFILVTRRGWGR